MIDEVTPRDRPEFEVRADGARLAPLVAADVVEIDVHEEIGRHGRATLLLRNWDPDSRSVRHSDGGPLLPGSEVEIWLGFDSELSTVFAGVVVAVAAHFPAEGHPVLRVEARSRSVLLDHPPRSRQLAEVTDADVAAAVAADYGLTAEADDGLHRSFVVSDRTSDWAFLTARADEVGWVVYVRDKVLVMRSPAEAEDPVALEYARTVVELHLTQDLTRSIGAAVGVGWDVQAAEPVESEQPASAAGIDHGDRPAHDAAVDDAGWPLRDARVESPAVAAADAGDARAVAAQRAAALAHVHGTCLVAGDPALRCDSWVDVRGVGERLSGPHYVTSARHRLSPGSYRTELQLGRPPRLEPRPARATGPGLVVGTVSSLKDPAELNRVRVKLDWRSDGGEGVWARLASIDAGEGAGAVFVPDEGQEVLCGFVDGDPSVLVVLGALYNGDRTPPVVVDPKTNAVRCLVSPEGHVLRLEDGKSSAVSLVSARGHGLVLDDTGDQVTLTHRDSGNAIVLSAEGIELRTEKGDLTLSAPQGTAGIQASSIEGTAKGPSKLESSGTLNVKASGSLGLQGAPVNINC